MSRLLVTGGAGFIGSHFIRLWLDRHSKDEIVNLDLLTYAGSRERLSDVESDRRYRFIHADICDAACVRKALEGCEVVVHFAAETHVDRSITDASPFLRTNVEGTYVLLQAAQAAGLSRVLYMSTDEVYGPVLSGSVDERAPLAPRSPYAASKAAGDLLARAYFETYQLPVIVARPTNVYGPGQFPEKFISLCITSALGRRQIPIYGDGQHRRAWSFVTDLCEAIAVILERGQVGQVYNVAGGTERANLETAQTILRIMGAPESLLEFVTDRPGHDPRYAMTDGKLRAFGWSPRVSFEQGLRETIRWYQSHGAWWGPRVEKLRQDPYHWLNQPARTGPQPLAGTI